MKYLTVEGVDDPDDLQFLPLVVLTSPVASFVFNKQSLF